ncbi:MAG: class C sortase [Peptoniphilus rhinitidis]|nr:class C sortase [Peptoniphilus rhinitidis]MDU3751170.1 class C sortase [Peptoniphilus rhinitidis]
MDKIGVITPISDNTSEQSLLEGSGIVEDTDIPTSEGNTITVLAGHRGGINETQSFLNIDKLENGDKLKITTREEELYYKVVDKEVIEPTDWSKFTREEGKTKLFLMACHPYPKNDKRLLVKAELIKNDEEINN